MKIHSNHIRVQLDRSQTLKVRDGEHCRVLCHSGCIWITCENDTRDIIVKANASFIIDRAGLTLMTALQPVDITLEALDPRQWNETPRLFDKDLAGRCVAKFRRNGYRQMNPRMR